jgi:hypothetical protein
MKMRTTRNVLVVLLAAVMLTLSTACEPTPNKIQSYRQGNQPQTAANMGKPMRVNLDLVAVTSQPTSTPTSTPLPPKKMPKAPAKLPTDPPAPSRTLEDTDASIKASEKRALSGDKFLDSLYERPFTSQEMIYQPDLDINSVDFGADDDYFYITVRLHGLNETKKVLTGTYAVEFDRTLTGRGDTIILVRNASSSWSTKNLSIYTDKNKDVGGPTPLVADAGFKGNGYDTSINVKGNTIAYARIDPLDKQAVQFAISRSLLTESKFLWSAWADNGLRKVKSFDYNDTMGMSTAGSPIEGEDYPLKALYNLDNTCRLPYGFEQIGSSYPGMCISGVVATEGGSNEGTDCYCNNYCIQGDKFVCCGQWVCD